MKIYDINKNEYVEAPSNLKSFLNEIDEICKKYNLSISHEDCHGSFIIENYSKNNIEWLKNANKNY